MELLLHCLKIYGGDYVMIVMIAWELRLVIAFWQAGIIDALTMARIILNAGTQYTTIVMTSIMENPDNIGFHNLIEPMNGFRIAAKYVIQSKGAERKARIATLAAYLSASTAAILTSSPTMNGIEGSAAALHIEKMREAINIRGGCSNIIPLIENFNISGKCYRLPSLKNYIVHTFDKFVENSIVENSIVFKTPIQMKFDQDCCLIIDNMFREHAKNRYLIEMAKTSKNSYPHVISSLTGASVSLANKKIFSFSLIAYSCLSVTVAIGIGYVGWLLFQQAKRKHYNTLIKPTDKIIDVIYSNID